MKKVISILLTSALLLSAASVPAFAESDDVKIYVSVNGNDANEGRQLTSAVKTIPRAIELAKIYKADGKATNVVFTSGTYYFNDTINLTEDESGTADAPVIFRAYREASVNFTSGQKVDWSKFNISDSGELQADVRGKVYEADLSGINISDAKNDGLCADGYLKQLAKWPNSGYANLTGTYDEDTHLFNFAVENNRAANWDKNQVFAGIWSSGYNYVYGSGISDCNENGIAIGLGTDTWGELRCSIFNSLYELDTPGEYYVDYENNKLYYYPEENGNNEIYFMNSNKNLFNMNGVSNIKFENINFRAVNGEVFNMRNCDNITIYGSEMSALGDCAVDASETTNLLLAANNISEMKKGAVKVSGGDQKTLTSSNDVIRNCRIHDMAKVYKTSNPAITIGEYQGTTTKGVGVTVKNCEIYNSPQAGISFCGNDHVIENNRIYNMLLDVWDSGFIYSMRSWVGRGTVIRNNYLYIQRKVFDYTHITDGLRYGAGTDNEGIYLDDLQSGITATGNIIYNISRGFDWGGGNDNVCTDNIVIDCRRGLRYDCRGLWEWGRKWINNEVQYGGLVYNEINNFINSGYDETLWSKYNGFARTVERVKEFNAKVAEDNSAENRLQALLMLGRPCNRTLNNNVFTGEWATLYRETPNKHNSFLFMNEAYLSDGVTKDTYATSSNWYKLMTDEEAGITVNDDEIEITGKDIPDGISKTTADMGVKEDEYIPTYSDNEFDVNTANRFTAIAAIYDGDGALKSVQSFKDCYFYNGQLVNLSIDVPSEADEKWYASVMMWDGADGMKPVLNEKITLLKQ